MKILIVEDNADAALAVELILQSLGHEAVVASGVAEATAVLRAGGVGMLLTDLTLPDGSGETLTAVAPDVPAVAMSGHPRDTHWAACERAGFVGYIEKPISVAGLVGAVEAVIKGASP